MRIGQREARSARACPQSGAPRLRAWSAGHTAWDGTGRACVLLALTLESSIYPNGEESCICVFDVIPAPRRGQWRLFYTAPIKDVSVIARHLSQVNVRGWLVSDYSGSNPVLQHLLGERLFLTRRAFLLITEDACRLLISRVDAVTGLTTIAGCDVETYTSWTELRAWLSVRVAPLGVVAMEYSPHGDLPAMSRVDGGMLDLIRDLGVEVRS